MPKLQHRLVIIFLVSAVILNLCMAVASANTPQQAKDGTSVSKTVHNEKDALPWDYTEPKEEPEKDTPVYITALSFIFKLAVVLGLAYLTILGLKKFSNMKSKVESNQQCIRVLDQSSLGANKSLHVIQVGSKRLLVASTPGQISLLSELDADDIPEKIAEKAPVKKSVNFTEQLAAFMGSKADSSSSAKTVADMLRESSSYFQDKVREVSKSRRKFRVD